MIDTIASALTAFGVLFAGVGIWMQRNTMRLDFEQHFTDRYRALSDVLPVEVPWRDEEFSHTSNTECERSLRLYL